jgi:hypothetical protein
MQAEHLARRFRNRRHLARRWPVLRESRTRSHPPHEQACSELVDLAEQTTISPFRLTRTMPWRSISTRANTDRRASAESAFKGSASR